MANGKIILTGMEFFAFHGFYAVEQKMGNNFIVDVSITLNLTEAGNSDNLADTVNYEKVYSIVKLRMEKTVSLIETVAFGIKKDITALFSNIENVEVKISKLNPAFPGKIHSVNIIV